MGLEASTLLHREDVEVSACIIVKGEAAELLDWIAHHKTLGNGSTPFPPLGVRVTVCPRVKLGIMSMLPDSKERKARNTGIGKFYIHDDYSAHPLLESLLGMIASGEVQYKYWASEDISGHGRQMETYEHCLAAHGHRHKVGLAFIILHH